MHAFWLLCSDRGATNRIRWTAIHLYSRSLGLSAAEEADMVFLVNRLDLAYLGWVNSKGKTGGNATGVQSKDDATKPIDTRKRKAGIAANRARN